MTGLFTPYLASYSRIKIHRRMMKSMRDQRGIQMQCRKCAKTCKVLATSSDLESGFVCHEAKRRKGRSEGVD
ncbi:MAG: hypothetical protein MUP52_08240 [Candidatus Aminicenantes bacterium]|nr:hypothetical protein [Candidatus Aminicenantes bacterium]